MKELDDIWMYDIKTHDPVSIEVNKGRYEGQLNVYAHIYESLRGNKLDHTAIISTTLPAALREAISEGDESLIQEEFDKWSPIVEIPFDKEKEAATVKHFAEVVDKIEDGVFEPVPVEKLKKKYGGTSSVFATAVCRNCDARFSCESYREYAHVSGGRSVSNFRKYIEDLGDDFEVTEYVTASLVQVADAGITEDTE